MSLYVDPPWSLGQTLGVTASVTSPGWVGAVKVFPDVSPVTGQVRSNKLKTCVAVRNSSGETLLAKRAVSFEPGSYTVVNGYTRETNALVAGVVDEFIPSSGVANGDVFWATVAGPTEFIVGQTVAVGDVVAAVTANTTNSTVAAGTGGYGSTVSVTVAPQVGRIGRVISGTTGTVTILASVVNQ